jgi:hypothetical protein
MTSIESPDRSARPKPRCFRCGLGTLLSLALLAAVAIGTVISIQLAKKRNAPEAKRQREAVRAVAKSGGILLYDFHDDSEWVDKRPVDTRTTSQVWLHSLLGADMFADVVEVGPGPSPSRVMTDATLAHLEQLPRLRTVELCGTQVTDAGLRHLEGLTQLQSLGLACTNITGSGLRHLKGLSQLQSLDLTETKVTNAGLSSLNGPTHLRKLFLGRTQVTDAGLENLKEMPELQVLFLEGTRITDAGLEHLSGLTQLNWLDLSHTQVTDAGLKHLQGLTQLAKLDLSYTMVSDVGVDSLQQTMPTCRTKSAR